MPSRALLPLVTIALLIGCSQAPINAIEPTPTGNVEFKMENATVRVKGGTSPNSTLKALSNAPIVGNLIHDASAALGAPGVWDGAVNNTTTQYFAQPVRFTESKVVTAVKIYTGTPYSSIAQTVPGHVRIFSDNAGVPGAIAYSEIKMFDSVVSENGFLAVTINLATPFAAEAGKTYWYGMSIHGSSVFTQVLSNMTSGVAQWNDNETTARHVFNEGSMYGRKGQVFQLFGQAPVTNTSPQVSIKIDGQTAASHMVRATGPTTSVAFTATVEDEETLTATCVDSSAAPAEQTPLSSPLALPLGAFKLTCTAEDSAGLTGTASTTVTVNDETPPTLTLPQNGMTKVLPHDARGTTPVEFTVSANDEVSGAVPVTCTTASGAVTSGASFPAGKTTVSCSATDKQGNTASGSFEVTISYAFAGFQQPVDNLPFVNLIKAGSGVPVKFSLGGDQGLKVLSGMPVVKTIACDSSDTIAPLDSTTSSVSGLTYDPLSGMYTYVWKTSKTAKGCAMFTLVLNDGTERKFEVRYQ